ncbi:ATP-grasp domain-containing protein [Parapedobacter koreensis]|uniref:Glutathione synthetase n=1 Tax=Parapedobacter koreensis TaxID=332977 RepID=A0A1H7JJX3_9SPHI|nr:glutathione synthetase [Parapedobacter koreensis]SEK74714.1 glutathione synthase [Parapedobacter koreensis]
MTITFVVNQVRKESPGYTTTALAFEAHRRGHTVYYVGIGDLVYLSDGYVGAHCRKVPDREFRSLHTFLEAVIGVEKQLVSSAEWHVMWLRNDPAVDMEKRPWAQDAGVLFGQLASKQGVLVLNNPDGLVRASNKIYLQYFPESVRPQTIVTRNMADVEAFYQAQKHRIILKPLKGSGGKNVFLLDKKEEKNRKQIVEAICRDGFVIAQEYLPAAKNGDTRLFLMEGQPLMKEGKVAAIHRVQQAGEIRSNIHQGGQAKRATMNKEMKTIVETIGPLLREDGMFLVGLDIVGDKLMEINVFSPGGLIHASEFHHVDFMEEVITAVEQKVANLTGNP